MLRPEARKAREKKYEEAEALGLLIVQRVEKYNVSQGHPNFSVCDDLCSHSRALFNSVSYYCRNLWRQGKPLPSYSELDNLCKHPPADLEHWQYHYQSLLAQPGQQVLIQLKEAWDSYFKALKAYRRDPSGFTGEPRIPGYTRTRNLVTIPQSFTIKDGYLHFLKSKKVLPLKLNPDSKFTPEQVVQVKIIPRATSYQVIVIYETTVRKVGLNVINLFDNQRRIIGIDLGVNNFLACANNVGLQPFVINGGEVKALNQYYNKVKAAKQEKLPFYYVYDSKPIDFIGPIPQKLKQQKWSKALKILTENRTQTLDDYLHKISRFLVDYCQHFQIDTVVVGYNQDWKQEIRLGRRNNQNFTYIPHRRFLDILKYKLEEAGILYSETNESYTSKCSFLDDEPLQHQDNYLGRRIHRGLFRSAKGIIFNADINGSLNIIRKVYPRAFDAGRFQGSRGCRLHPIKLKGLPSLSFRTSSLSKCNYLETVKIL
jgi:putative transposase